MFNAIINVDLEVLIQDVVCNNNFMCGKKINILLIQVTATKHFIMSRHIPHNVCY